jgi:hypothetical protein
MTLAELIADLRQGDASPDTQRRAAELLQQWQPAGRGRPRAPYWRQAGALIDSVERLTAVKGSRKRAFEALAGKREPDTIKRYYRAAKRWERTEAEWIETVFSEQMEGDKK